MVDPYQTPRSHSTQSQTPISKLISSAKRNIHILGFLLAIPCFYNFFSFQLFIFRIRSFGFGYAVASAISAIFIGIVLTMYLAFAFRALNLVSRALRNLFGYTIKQEHWDEIFLNSTRRLLWTGCGAAICWALFVFGFYSLRLPYIVIGNLTAIPANISMAFWYVPLFYQWYQLRSKTETVMP